MVIAEAALDMDKVDCLTNWCYPIIHRPEYTPTWVTSAEF